jgi:gamma-glutamylcyclotransferase (GGCT)/AIG2-like uncharacterized protein YtfP
MPLPNAKERVLMTSINGYITANPPAGHHLPKVFVYGTLKRDFADHALLQHAEYFGEDSLLGYALYNVGGIPIAVREGVESSLAHSVAMSVEGEVYGVPEATLAELDKVMHSSAACKRRSEILLRCGAVWVYGRTAAWEGEVRHLIPSGVWSDQATSLRPSSPTEPSHKEPQALAPTSPSWIEI